MYRQKKIKIEVKEVKGKFLKTKDFEITALPLDHDAPCNGYLFEEKDKLRIDKEKLKKIKISARSPELAKLTMGKNIKVNGKTINYQSLTYKQKGKKISFVLDTKICANAKKLVKNSDLAVMESTFLEESEKGAQLAKEYKHLTAKQAAQIAKQGKAKQLVLTHLSQRYENKEDLLLNEAKKVFPNTTIAEDFTRIEI